MKSRAKEDLEWLEQGQDKEERERSQRNPMTITITRIVIDSSRNVTLGPYPRHSSVLTHKSQK